MIPAPELMIYKVVQRSRGETLGMYESSGWLVTSHMRLTPDHIWAMGTSPCQCQ